MKTLITGGAGFIGSNYCYYVVNKYPNEEFICLDDLTYAGNYNNISEMDYYDDYLYPNFRFIKGNITNREFIYKLFEEEKFDNVINFAAESHVDNSILNPEIFLKTNIIGTSVLMDACVKYGINRFHQISTDEVYGDLPLDRPELKFTENSPIKPSSPYSASKASADMLVMAYHRTYGLPVTISRCSNNYGPRQFPEKLIPLIITRALEYRKIPIYGTGLNVRDWIHVDDHNKGVDMIVRNGKVGEIYNLGGHNEKSNLEIARLLLKLLGREQELITHTEDRKGHDLRYAIDSTKAENELGWYPETNFEKGIKKTINWYLLNPEWTSSILDGSYRKIYEKTRGKN